jgi:hypothetical protein
MVQRRRCPGLLNQASPAIRVPDPLASQDLEGNHAAQRTILRPVDFPHPADSLQMQDVVPFGNKRSWCKYACWRVITGKIVSLAEDRRLFEKTTQL